MLWWEAMELLLLFWRLKSRAIAGSVPEQPQPWNKDEYERKEESDSQTLALIKNCLPAQLLWQSHVSPSITVLGSFLERSPPFTTLENSAVWATDGWDLMFFLLCSHVITTWCISRSVVSTLRESKRHRCFYFFIFFNWCKRRRLDFKAMSQTTSRNIQTTFFFPLKRIQKHMELWSMNYNLFFFFFLKMGISSFKPSKKTYQE